MSATKIPNWVRLGEDTKIDPTVKFIPYQNKPILIGKRVIIDSGSVLYGGVDIGNDSIVGHNSVVRFNTTLGVHSIIGNLCVVDGNLSIGNHTLIHSNIYLGQKATIGNYVFMGPQCITTNDPKLYYYRKGYSKSGDHWKLLQGPTVKDYARIAAGVLLFPEITVGIKAVVGAGSVVTKDVPDYAVTYGVPAKIRRYINPDEDEVIECKVNHA